ncbi:MULTISPECIES: zinc ribbon domain-containing protein [unclassified Meiothermus]|uniref:RNA-guided endonuclease InsQ/TnpB family protein n=1 Tax=unclassified Meiothermus TaxID=370471 RepID=UPI0018F1FE63|nr:MULTISPECIES: zinc ribbon domain-containing protein [unclassified Meiothermus]
MENPEERLKLEAGKLKTVTVKVGESQETRELIQLGSQVKQGIQEEIRRSLRSLAALKRKGHRVGRLRFKAFVNALPLKQFGITYSFKEGQKVSIQNLEEFRVLGLRQIPQDAEIANAVLVRKPSGFYLHVTVYTPKNPPSSEGTKSKPIDKPIGLDFGVKHQLTLSNGLRFGYEIPTSKRIQKLQRRLARQEKGSKNHNHTRHLLRRGYERLSNRKKDIQNKLIAFLKGYAVVAFQDDQVKGWQEGLFGRQVQSTAIGGLKARLRESLATLVVDRYEATSRECFRCGSRFDLTLSDRWVHCSCGWEADRDRNASLVILRKGLGLSPDQALGLDRPEATPLEMKAAVRTVGSNPYVRISLVGEGGSLPL